MAHPIETWDRFVSKMQEAKEAWEDHRALCMSTDGRDALMNGIGDLPIEAVRILAGTFNRAEFDVAIPRMIEYWRRSGGIDSFRFPSVVQNLNPTTKRKKKGDHDG